MLSRFDEDEGDGAEAWLMISDSKSTMSKNNFENLLYTPQEPERCLGLKLLLDCERMC